METVTLEEFLKKVTQDPALREKLPADPEAALEALRRMAEEKGYALEIPAGAQALSDEDLAPVSGGLNAFLVNNLIPQREGELNRYSWFVTLLRQLTGWDEEHAPEGPEGGYPTGNGK